MTTPVKARVAAHRARKRKGLVQAGPYWVHPDIKYDLDQIGKRAESRYEYWEKIKKDIVIAP